MEAVAALLTGRPRLSVAPKSLTWFLESRRYDPHACTHFHNLLDCGSCPGEQVMKTRIAFACVITAFISVPTARGQVTIDVAKITCDQYLLFKVTDPRNISIWLSGFYHGKNGITVVDQQALRDNEDKVKDYCRGHLNVPVMQAVETLLTQGQLAR
jgi:acid stress chaperone HdeB